MFCSVNRVNEVVEVLKDNQCPFFHSTQRYLTPQADSEVKEITIGFVACLFPSMATAARCLLQVFSINKRLLNWPGLALWGREVLRRGWEWNVVFGVKKQLFANCKSFHDVGLVYLIMMTLDPITPESGSQHPCPAI